MTTPVAAKTILVLDDSPFVLEVARDALESAGFSVAVAVDLAAFQHARTTTSPDLILVDVQMPEAFGDDLASLLRGAHGVKTPILLVSNLEDGELARRACEAEVDGWISKREGVHALVRRVKEVLA